MRELKRPVLAALLGLVCVATGTHADDASELKQFVDQYKCSIVERLILLHSAPQNRNRFLIVEMDDREQSFVQCLFPDSRPRENKLYCEAASGAYEARRSKEAYVPLPETALGALARLGFATDNTDRNHSLELAYRGPDDFNKVAVLLLTALYQAYGARLGRPLTLNAPLARIDLRQSRCVPTS